MHVFLQGPRNIGKSTVIRKTLDILSAPGPVRLGGFFTWNGGDDDPHIYIAAAESADGSGEDNNRKYRLASFDPERGGLKCDTQIFETIGVELLTDGNADADLLIMDELGFLENSAPKFRRAVLDAIAGSIPVLGVLRLGDIKWHAEIKRDPSVALYDVNTENRDALPQVLAEAFNL